jgi:hypothetical protein
VLLLLVTISLELPASQATLRSSNGSGAVYATSGLLVGSGPAKVDSCGDPARLGAVLDLRAVPGQVFQEHMIAVPQ